MAYSKPPIDQTTLNENGRPQTKRGIARVLWLDFPEADEFKLYDKKRVGEPSDINPHPLPAVTGFPVIRAKVRADTKHVK